MRKSLPAVLLVGFLIIITGGMAQAITYNPATDFSLTNGNPNGVWTYGWMPNDFSIFHAFTATVDQPGYGFLQWYTPGMSTDYSPTVCFNDTPIIIQGVAPGQITLHPGPQLQAAVVRFTTPFDALLNIDGRFFAGNVGVMWVGVRQGSTWLWNGIDHGSFSIPNYYLSTGGSIDFMVYGSYGAGQTPLGLLISSTPVPEPATMLLLGSGLLGIAGLKRRRYGKWY